MSARITVQGTINQIEVEGDYLGVVHDIEAAALNGRKFVNMKTSDGQRNIALSLNDLVVIEEVKE